MLIRRLTRSGDSRVADVHAGDVVSAGSRGRAHREVCSVMHIGPGPAEGEELESQPLKSARHTHLSRRASARRQRRCCWATASVFYTHTSIPSVSTLLDRVPPLHANAETACWNCSTGRALRRHEFMSEYGPRRRTLTACMKYGFVGR